VEPQWEEKCWGRTRIIQHTDAALVYELELGLVGAFCSKHYHRYRANEFRVLKGCVRVVWESITLGDCPCVFFADLYTGSVLLIPAKIKHQFQVISPASRLMEIYTSDGGDVEIDDIYRDYEGGFSTDIPSSPPGFAK
jgi:mannose-6-phosphate isomerase-like protein (cupin superfamily)